jgi:hypothetical protein
MGGWVGKWCRCSFLFEEAPEEERKRVYAGVEVLLVVFGG